MKKCLLLSLLAFASVSYMQADSSCSDNSCNTSCSKKVETSCDACDCAVNSKTFFTVRPHHQAASHMRLSSNRYYLHPDEEENNFHFTATIFGGRSTHKGRMASYFTPDCQTNLKVTEITELDRSTDVLAPHFNTVSANRVAETTPTFESVISFAPQQSTIGAGLTFRYNFCHNDDNKSYWLEVSTPITRVKNTMGFFEKINEEAGGAGNIAGTEDEVINANMTEAFKQAAWDCGRIDCSCELTKTRLADIDVRFGKEWVKEDGCHLESYAGILIPTGNKPKSINMFEPIVGHNKHFGIMFGSDAGMRIWENMDCDRALWAEFTMHGLYLFKNDEKRLIDLKNKPWSRFMPVVTLEQTIAAEDGGFDLDDFIAVFNGTPGVNVFCKDVCVRPGLQRTYNSALIYTAGGFQGELGYNFFCRPSECVELDCKWEEKYALRAIIGSDTNPINQGILNKVHQINNDFNFVNELVIIGSSNGEAETRFNDNVIKACDLDMNSAAAPCMVTHTIYGSLGYNWRESDYPWFLSAGGGYEFGSNNTAMSRWSAWGSVGFSF